MNEIVVLRSISKGFGRYKVLSNLNLLVPRGVIYGIYGANGCGKSVLLRCICGITPIDSGEILIANQSIGRRVDFAPSTGVMLEKAGFIDALSGIKNLRLLMKLSKGGKDSECENVMELVGLDPEDTRCVRTYSLGMKQRLGLAQALMGSPDLLLLDEPYNRIDKDGIALLQTLFAEMRAQGTTIIMTSQDDAHLNPLCDKVLELNAGHLLPMSYEEGLL